MFGIIDLVSMGVIVTSFAVVLYKLQSELKVKA